MDGAKVTADSAESDALEPSRTIDPNVKCQYVAINQNVCNRFISPARIVVYGPS
jgi:hypothetical protein